MIDEMIKNDITLFDISEDGSIWVEKTDNSLYLYTDESEINLNKTYSLIDRDIMQNNNVILFHTKQEVDYFIKLLEDLNAS